MVHIIYVNVCCMWSVSLPVLLPCSEYVLLCSCYVNCVTRTSSACRRSISHTLIAKCGCCLTTQNMTSGFVLQSQSLIYIHTEDIMLSCDTPVINMYYVWWVAAGLVYCIKLKQEVNLETEKRWLMITRNLKAVKMSINAVDRIVQLYCFFQFSFTFYCAYFN